MSTFSVFCKWLFQKEKQKQDSKWREYHAQDNKKFQQETLKEQGNQTIEIIDHQNREKRLIENSPLRLPADTVEQGIPDGVLRAFIVPPRQLVLKGSTIDTKWEEVHTNYLVENIRIFIQKNFNPNSSIRPIHLYSHDVLNKDGVRGEIATRILKNELSNNPTIWIESNRVSLEKCSLSLSMWGEGYQNVGYNSIGYLPNYDIAVKSHYQNMGLSLLFEEQGNNSLTDLSSMDIPKLNEKEIEIVKEAFNKLLKEKNTHEEIVSSSGNVIETKAVAFLSEAYKMLFAMSADLHYLRVGIPPILPELISKKVFNMEDKYIKGVTSHILSSYIQASAVIASKDRTNAPLIWTGIAESLLAIGENEGAKDSFFKALTPNKNSTEIYSTDTKISSFLKDAYLKDTQLLKRISDGLKKLDMLDEAEYILNTHTQSTQNIPKLAKEKRDEFEHLIKNTHDTYFSKDQKGNKK